MGLIKTGLKAAVAVKVAHMVHDRIEQRKQEQWAATGQPGTMPGLGGHPGAMAAPAGAPQATAAAAASPPGGDVLDQLAKLGELKAAGVLTEAEFQAQKARILNGLRPGGPLLEGKPVAAASGGEIVFRGVRVFDGPLGQLSGATDMVVTRLKRQRPSSW